MRSANSWERRVADPLFGKLTLIGIGLIGSSIAHAARKNGLVGEIAVQTRSQKTLERAVALGLGDTYTLDPAEAAKGADLVIVCVPVGASGEVAAAIGPVLKPGATVSDVGSVKMSVIRQMQKHLPKTVHFVPAHPIAGTEHSGPDAGFAELFQNRWCILTPPDGIDTAAVDRLEAFWRGIGANVEVMSAEHHDLVLAITSHIPHLIAYNIVGTAADMEESVRAEVMKFSASGFRDFTRIAASDPTMWRDIFLHNKDAVLEMLGRFTEDLTSLQRAIRRGDGDALFDLFTRTRAIRRGIVEIGQDTAVPDFGRTPAAKGHGGDE
jgi:cyclohexadieny/prephenate dehydrogenase